DSPEQPAVTAGEQAGEKKDPFEEIDFGSYFREYLDPGFRSPQGDFESSERPSFENFLSKPGTLTDHLMWQLGSLNVRPPVFAAAELVIGNLNEEGYLTASEDELLGVARAEVAGEPAVETKAISSDPESAPLPESEHAEESHLKLVVSHVPSPEAAAAENKNHYSPVLQFTREDLREATQLIRQFDPVGVGARNLRECLLSQLDYLQKTRAMEGSEDPENDPVIEDAHKIV